MTILRWLTRPRPAGVTWGVPWPRGAIASGTPFALGSVPVQSWVTATWPDGTVKWTAHAISPQPDPVEAYELSPGQPSASAVNIHIVRSQDSITVDTGAVVWAIPLTGDTLVSSARRGPREILRDVRLVSLWQGEPTPDGAGTVARQEMRGQVSSVTVEQDGPVRAVLRLDGSHAPTPRTPKIPEFAWQSTSGSAPDAAIARQIPGSWFTVRLYFYAGAQEVRVVHTFVWDGDPERDFLAGLGLRADVPMRDEPHDRHIRLAGPGGGFLTEAVRGITGLRRDPGERFRRAQVAGRPCGPVQEWNEAVSRRTHLIPQWSDWTLDQTSADGFSLRKRTGPGCGWVGIAGSTRSEGYGYVGGTGGGLGFGLRDFWKVYPTRLDIRGAATGVATATVWLWSPSAPAMDLRFYHDGLGQNSYPEQLEGLEITYEDYEPGYGTPYGIARTHELVLRAYESTPSGEELAEHAGALNDPPLLVCSPHRLHEAGVFGDWAPVDRSSPARAGIEDRLDFLFDFYAGQREQRRWYGFWDYGDVMHAYDPDRHQWRYDIGGYAWDNSELSPDLWLWFQFLRTGRADVFRFAEAMTRHTGEVDVYHLGRWSGLGTRHNVQHWGCSAKQLRISSAIYRRPYYYLTADERTGDLLRELAGAEQTFLAVDPIRKVRSDVYTADRRALSVGLGTDWGALAAAWLTEWERTGDLRARDKLLGTMEDIAAMPQGFLTGEALLDLDTGRFDTTRDRIAISHLSAVFGLVEVCSELIALQEVPGFEQAWLRYCRLYLATPQEQEQAVGQRLSGISLVQAHSRLAAYAAARTGDEALARLAWRAFRHDVGDQLNTNPLQRQPHWQAARVAGPTVLAPVDEAPWVSTNDAAQYGLAAIQNLALLGEPD
jgi:YetA-like protein